MPHRMLMGNPIIDTWVVLHQIADSIERCEDIEFSKINMMVQDYQVVRAINCINGVTTPTKITKFLDKSPNYVTFILDRLEKEGIIERKRDLDDRRSMRILLTAKGKEKYSSALKPAEDLPKEIFSGISQEELSILLDILLKIREKTFKYRNVKDTDIIE